MRKPPRLSPAELAPFVWTPPKIAQGMWGDRPADPAEVPAQPPPRIDWAEMFGNPNPVEIEVGFGKGLFLVNAGTSRPDRNFFGIEIVRKYQMYAANRVARRQLANVRTAAADAKKVLRESVVPGSVAAVHVYFPDPWWKKRHEKRRLFTDEFAALVSLVLIPGGILHFVSDVSDYFDMVTAVLAGRPELVPVPATAPTAAAHDMDYLTNFERKFRKEGRPIYRSRYEKTAGAA